MERTATNSIAACARPACATAVFDDETEQDSIATLTQATLTLMAIIERTEPSGECMLWTGATSSGHPIFKPRGCNPTTVRRVVYLLTTGSKLRPHQPISTDCNDKLCVNPAHLRRSTAKKIAKKAAANGAWKSRQRSLRNSITQRKKAKLQIEQAREIRNSPDSAAVLAKRYGVSKSLVGGIKRGDVWRDHDSPWSQLL